MDAVFGSENVLNNSFDEAMLQNLMRPILERETARKRKREQDVHYARRKRKRGRLVQQDLTVHAEELKRKNAALRAESERLESLLRKAKSAASHHAIEQERDALLRKQDIILQHVVGLGLDRGITPGARFGASTLRELALQELFIHQGAVVGGDPTVPPAVVRRHSMPKLLPQPQQLSPPASLLSRCTHRRPSIPMSAARIAPPSPVFSRSQSTGCVDTNPRRRDHHYDSRFSSPTRVDKDYRNSIRMMGISAAETASVTPSEAFKLRPRMASRMTTSPEALRALRLEQQLVASILQHPTTMDALRVPQAGNNR